MEAWQRNVRSGYVELLSKFPIKPEFDDAVEVSLVTRHLPVSETHFTEFRTKTANDPELRLLLLRDMVITGWPNNRDLVLPTLLPYYPMWDDLVYCDGLLFRDNHIVVPKSMQKNKVNKIHESHQGIVKSKQRARMILFWPGMNSEIEDAVGSCVACRENRKAQPSESLISHEIPDRPWAKQEPRMTPQLAVML